MFLKYTLILLKSFTLLVVAVVGLWFVLLTVYVVAPTELTDSASEEFTYGLESAYSPVTKFFKRVARSDRAPFELAFGFDPRWAGSDSDITLWLGRCAGSYPDVSTAAKFVSGFTALQDRIPRERNLAKYEMQRLQERSRNFSITIICLGMLTTIFAGLKSSEYSQAGRRFGSHIKVLAIVFPATVTAVTALSSLLAGQDQIAKQAQIHFGLITLSSEISSQVLTMNCPSTGTEAAPLLATLGDWSRRFSDIVASANRPGPEQQPKHATSADVASEEAGRQMARFILHRAQELTLTFVVQFAG